MHPPPFLTILLLTCVCVILSNTDTLGPLNCILIKEVSSFQGANSTYLYKVGTWSSGGAPLYIYKWLFCISTYPNFWPMCAYSGTTVVLLYSKLESVAQAMGLPCSALLRSPPPSRYIRVVGVYNSMNRSFHLVSFACLHTSRPFQLSTEGIIGEHTLSHPTIFVSQKTICEECFTVLSFSSKSKLWFLHHIRKWFVSNASLFLSFSSKSPNYGFYTISVHIQ